MRRLILIVWRALCALAWWPADYAAGALVLALCISSAWQ